MDSMGRFAAFASSQPKEVLRAVLRDMVEALSRPQLDGQSAPAPTTAVAAGGEDGYRDGQEPVPLLAEEVLQLLEEQAGSNAYIEVYTQVQRTFTLRRERRRMKRATEALVDPRAAAERKSQRNLLKKVTPPCHTCFGLD